MKKIIMPIKVNEPICVVRLIRGNELKDHDFDPESRTAALRRAGALIATHQAGVKDGGTMIEVDASEFYSKPGHKIMGACFDKFID